MCVILKFECFTVSEGKGKEDRLPITGSACVGYFISPGIDTRLLKGLTAFSVSSETHIVKSGVDGMANSFEVAPVGMEPVSSRSSVLCSY